MKVPEFDKHLKKVGGHIGRNVVEITIKMKTIVQKPLMIKIIKLRHRNFDSDYLMIAFATETPGKMETRGNFHVNWRLKLSFLDSHPFDFYFLFVPDSRKY